MRIKCLVQEHNMVLVSGPGLEPRVLNLEGSPLTMKPPLTVLFQVGMDKNIASLSVPLGQLKEEVLVSVCVESNRPSQ